jgi:hypothetical protein
MLKGNIVILIKTIILAPYNTLVKTKIYRSSYLFCHSLINSIEYRVFIDDSTLNKVSENVST